MESREEALKQLETIKQAVLNRSRVLPESPNHYFVWSLLSAGAITISYWIGIAESITGLGAIEIFGIYLLIMLVVGFAFTSMFLHKSLEEDELVCTKELRLFRDMYLFCLSFASIVSIILSTFGGWAFTVCIWLFCVGLAMHVENSLANRVFGRYGLFLVVSSLCLSIGGYVYLLEYKTIESMHLFANISTVLALVLISGAFAFFGFKLQKLKK